MSIATCDNCGRYVDTDDDCEFYCDLPTYTNMAQPVNPAVAEVNDWIGLCPSCREGHVDEAGVYWENGLTP